MLKGLFIAAVACTLTYTIPSGTAPLVENEDIKYVRVIGHQRCVAAWNVIPFNWRLCQCPNVCDSIFLTKLIVGRQGQVDTIIISGLSNTWTFWVICGDDAFITNWARVSNFVSNKYP